MNLREELNSVLSALRASRIDYAICGGMALAIHGYPRFTQDLDLLIQEEDLEKVREAVAPLGFLMDTGWLTFGAGTETEMRLYRLLKVEGASHLVLDLICVSPILEDAWSSRVEYELGAERITVVSREGLIAMKRISGRDQDMLDIRKLEGADDE